MNKFLKQHWRACFLLYILIYLPWFFYIESIITPDSPNLHIMHSSFDNLIPFSEYFIIPYILWFFYIAFACIFIYFKGSDSEFLKLAISLVLGMSLALTICMIYPSGHDLRPTEFARNNVFTHMVTLIYSADTPTNIFPSIHVYNSLAIHISLSKMKVLQKYWWVKSTSLILCIFICLSTVFLKQHSILDVIGASVMMVILYIGIYCIDYSKIFTKNKVIDY